MSSVKNRGRSFAVNHSPMVSCPMSSGEMEKETSKKSFTVDFKTFEYILRYAVSYANLCSSHPAISAVQDFSKGVACGKRDSRWAESKEACDKLLLKGLPKDSRNITH